MPSVLAWIDHDSKARERTLRILSLFQEKESRDELGLGSVRDSFADQLFPGTSTIQTRLRYMLFVPWIYHSLEEKRLPAESFAIQADKLERDLVQPLMDSDDQAGVFGKTAGKRLKRLPSSVYWAGLGAWGIRITRERRTRHTRDSSGDGGIERIGQAVGVPGALRAERTSSLQGRRRSSAFLSPESIPGSRSKRYSRYEVGSSPFSFALSTML